MSEVVNTALRLVSVSSPTRYEEPLCDELIGWATQRFPQGRIQRVRHGFSLEPHPDQPSGLALVGHIDTVPQAEQQRLGIEGDWLYGCGASDMKAGVAVMMHLLELNLPANPIGLFYDREEGPYADNGLDALLDQIAAPPLAVVLEPTNNQIHAGCVGSIQARAHFTGKRAHSARPWQGENAVYKAISMLAELRDRGRVAVNSQGLEFYEVVSATQAFTEGPTNAVPERFTLNLNSRFAPGKSNGEAIAELEDLCQRHGAELEVLDVAPSGAVLLDHPAVQSWIRSCHLEIEPKQAWTDVARLFQRGIPAFNFGPGDPAQAHQADERVSCSSINDNFRLLRKLIDAIGQSV